MLVFPIINQRRVMNVELKLKNASKIKKRVHYDDAKESEIVVNKEKFSNSIYHQSRDINAPIDFIRSKSLLYQRNFLVTTKQEEKTKLYDVYEVPQPPKKVSDNLDKLYSKTITDMRKEIPGKQNRGRYVSFEDLGIDADLPSEKIEKLQKVMKEKKDGEDLKSLFEKAGIIDLQETLHFFKNFECTILSDSIIPEDSLQDTLNALSSINTRDYRNLKKYYHMAKSNTEVYAKISYINKMIYDKPLSLMHTSPKQKQYIKKMEDMDYAKAS